MQVIERVRQTSTYLELKYISRPAYSFVMGWLWTGVFLIAIGCFGIWYTSTQLQVNMQLVCERPLPSEINCHLHSSTLIKEQPSIEINQLKTVELRHIWWTEDSYQVVFVAASGEVSSISDNYRPAIEQFVNHVNHLINSSQERKLQTGYDLRWKVILLLGFISAWLVMALVMFPSPLFNLDFCYIYAFDQASNQVTSWECALFKKQQQTWQLDEVQDVQLDEEITEDGTFNLINLMLSSGEEIALISWRKLPLQTTQFIRAAHRISQFLDVN